MRCRGEGKGVRRRERFDYAGLCNYIMESCVCIVVSICRCSGEFLRKMCDICNRIFLALSIVNVELLNTFY